MNESILQQQIVLFFRNEYQMHGKGLIFSVPNEATYKNKKYANTGVLNGVSDLVVVLHQKVIFVELKTKTKQSDKQLKFQQQVENLKHEYHIVYTLEQFKELLCTQ